MKKYYVWYKAAWDTPQRLQIFDNLEDFIDFITITCMNRGYEIVNASTLENSKSEVKEYVK